MSGEQDRQMEAVELEAQGQLCLLCLEGEEEGMLFSYTDPIDHDTIWFHIWCLTEAQAKVRATKTKRAGAEMTRPVQPTQAEGVQLSEASSLSNRKGRTQMAQAISVQVYTNKKGTERVSITMDRATAVKLAGYEGEEAFKLTQTQVAEALVVSLHQEERENGEAS